MNRSVISWLWLVLLPLCLGQSAHGKTPSSSPAGRVSYLKGWAQVKRGGQWTRIEKGSALRWGDLVATGKKRTRLEIRLADGSVVRLGRNSRLSIDKARFSSSQREFSAKLLKGKVYALVSHFTGSDSSFKIATRNAVAGVRGTTFRIDAKKDRSTVVRVYTGAVAVSNAPIFAKPGRLPKAGKRGGGPRQGVKPGGPGRVEVAGPQEISKHEWEEMIAKAMQEIRVSAAGKLSPPVAFDAQADAADEWVAWNKSRDEQVKK